MNAVPFMATLLIGCLSLHPLAGKVIYVSKSGHDDNPGTAQAPCLRISHAAQLAQAGDTVVVGAGTYREYIDPPRGGTPSAPIVYQAKPGEVIFVKGSEVVTGWVQGADGIWTTTVDHAVFGDYNPFGLSVDGDFQTYGFEHTRGAVYLDGHALAQATDIPGLAATPMTWSAHVEDGLTSIRANFGAQDPNESLTEINVRELIFFPTRLGVNYIILDGFRFLHAAPNWQAPNVGPDDPNPLTQVGAIGSKMGKGWIIRNCEIAHSRTAGIMMGETFDMLDQHENIALFGSHLIQNNHIHHCGEYGIAGQKGLARSTISGNLIEDINHLNEFGGHETAGIKVWNCVDVTIKNNLVRRVSGDIHGYAVWIDFANQGTRISQNIFYETAHEPVYMEANFGPSLLDNNILVGSAHGLGVKSHSGGSVFVHNLFINCQFLFDIQEKPEGRLAYPLVPHTMKMNGFVPVLNQHNTFMHNIFSNDGARKPIFPLPEESNSINENVYVGPAGPDPADKKVVVFTPDLRWQLTTLPQGVVIEWQCPQGLTKVQHPLVLPGMVAAVPLAGQGLEDADGQGLSIDMDVLDNRRSSQHNAPGPWHMLHAGKNQFVWLLQDNR